MTQFYSPDLAGTTGDAAMFGHRSTTNHSLKLPSTKVVASTTQRRAEIPLWCSNSQK